MPADDIRVPREHDRVIVEGRDGVLTVVAVDEARKTVSLQYVTGDGPVLDGVPWTALGYMGEENGDQAASEMIEDK
jgi:hypothetical protein